MKFANVFLGTGLGGIEQAFVDYDRALTLKGYDVVNFVHKNGQVKDKLSKESKTVELPFRKRSPLTFWALYQAFKREKPDMMLVHFKKALFFCRIIGKILGIPVVGIAHNSKTKHIIKADFVFSVTEYQRRIFIENGYDPSRIFTVPNMIDVNQDFKPLAAYRTPPVVGMLGRFDPMKGLEVFVDGLYHLKKKGVAFKAKIAGKSTPDYEDYYQGVLKKIEDCGLKDDIEFVGWLADKKDFYDGIDIFVLPSKWEPFGIVLLEAMMFSKPVVASTAEGPSEIFSGTNAALLFEKGSGEALAGQLEKIIDDHALASSLVTNAYALVKQKYDLKTSGAETLFKAVSSIFPQTPS